MSFYVEISHNGGLPSTRLVHHFYPVAAKPGVTHISVDSLYDRFPTEEFEVAMPYEDMKTALTAGTIPRFDLMSVRR